MSDIRPMPLDSQGGTTHDVLLFNADASSVDLYECAASRLEAVGDLLDALSYPVTLAGGDGAALASSVARATSLLLSDARGLLAPLYDTLAAADAQRLTPNEG